MDGVVGRMEGDEDATDVDAGLTGVLLLRKQMSLFSGLKERRFIEWIDALIPVADVRSSREREKGLVFGEWGAAIVAPAVTIYRAAPRAQSCARGEGRWAGGRRGRRRIKLWQMQLQAFLLTSLQSRHSWRHSQPGDATTRRQRQTVLSHGCADVRGSRLHN